MIIPFHYFGCLQPPQAVALGYQAALAAVAGNLKCSALGKLPEQVMKGSLMSPLDQEAHLWQLRKSRGRWNQIKQNEFRCWFAYMI